MKTRDIMKIATFYCRFTPNYTKIGYYARRPSWGSGPAWDFSGQRWLVTGGSLGIGKAIVKVAAEAGAEVIMVARNEQRLQQAREEVASEARDRVKIIAADMSLVSGTQKLLDELLASGNKFDVLMNNVGLLLNDLEVTSEGKEASFATNVLSHYQLTEGLLRNGGLNDEAVIINMTSGGMYNAPLGIRGMNITKPEKYNGKAAYAYAKRAQVALTGYWDDKYRDKGIRSYVTHPGWAKTPGVKTALPVFWKLQNVVLRTPLQGADTALWLCMKRPEQSGGDGVWFDRAYRPGHIYAFTRKPQCTVDELVAYLESELSNVSVDA